MRKIYRTTESLDGPPIGGPSLSEQSNGDAPYPGKWDTLLISLNKIIENMISYKGMVHSTKSSRIIERGQQHPQ